ncbi:hypothetical protein NSK_003209 [Nannochloropsis salina CCMP1776]|uniref:Uncharacterized protein n=1 Tax=Nannochloropsis salina CCMP1776 TaxID=1027361 RepID=A0A4D9D6R1_9STRA|nr:hypothetical protein NSK_003209 [Nannochloropsis salina CCMP1776]|eukprot:TFJ85703.1 hypothetical protein NSK_003209 [Nannochloropsis salina CCMP1776]
MPNWWNLPFRDFVVKEVMRPGFREFAVGAAVVFFGLGLKINAGITDKDREESPYYQDFLAPKKEGGAHGHH